MPRPPFYRPPGSGPIHPVEVGAISVLARQQAAQNRSVVQQQTPTPAPNQALTYTAKSPIILTGTVFSIPLASSTGDGYLSAANWTTFNAKEPALGNPASNGYLLSSDTSGNRSWVAPGGGGSGFPTVTLTKPIAADFPTWVNQNGASISDGVTGLVFNAPNAIADPIQTQIYSSTPFTGTIWTVRLTFTNGPVRNPVFNINLAESGTGKAISLGIYQGNGSNASYLRQTYSSYSSGTRVDYIFSGSALRIPMPWLRIRISSGTIYSETSGSGEVGDWQTIDSVTLATYFTTGPDLCGFSLQDLAGGSSMVINSAQQT